MSFTEHAEVLKQPKQLSIWYQIKHPHQNLKMYTVFTNDTKIQTMILLDDKYNQNDLKHYLNRIKCSPFPGIRCKDWRQTFGRLKSQH